MKFFAILYALSTAAVSGAASAVVGTVRPPADDVRGAVAGGIPKPVAPGAAEEAAGLFPFDPNDTVGLRAVASAAAPSGARRPGLNILEDAVGGVSALRESPPQPSSPVAAEEAADLFPLKERGWRKLTAEVCPNGVGHVDCVDGYDVETGQTCQAACGGVNNMDCCGGGYTDACEGFTGRVCRDGSCIGVAACKSAKVDLISDSCNRDHTNTDLGWSCHLVSSRINSETGHSIARIIGSCNGHRSCEAFFWGATLTGGVLNSCNGGAACQHFGEDRYPQGGSIMDGMILNSCNGDGACRGIMIYNGNISGDISNSCHSGSACAGVVSNGGSIGGIYNSCLGVQACYEMAVTGIIKGVISDSCVGGRACDSMARHQGSQIDGAISNSCRSDYFACFEFALYGVVNGAISDSCLGNYACRRIAQSSVTIISHGLDGCCETANSCDGASEANLPDDCAAISTTSPPTTAPTKTPTSTPTSSPTTSPPTTAPTNSPTSSPIKAPWEINRTSTESNFTSSNPNGTITMKFLIGKERNHTESAFAGMCDPAQEGGTAIDAGVMTTHVELEDSDFPNMDQLTVEYEFDMGSVAGSNAYDNNTDTIKFCQQVELVQYLDDGTNFVIAQQLTNVAVVFNLTTGFTVDVNLDEAEVNEANGTADLDSFIFAIHCDGSEEMNERPVGTKIKPNDDLDICVKSSSPDVEIEEISSMMIQGKKPDGTDSSLAVVADGSPSIPAITYYTHQTATGVAVRTRVPTNGFDFEAENAFISVVGSVALNLKGGRRRLANRAGLANRDLQAADEDVASFDLSVSLEPEESSVGNAFVVTPSSAKDGPGHEGLLAFLATLLASALAFVW